MEAIMNLAKKYNLYVIEDAAQATGAEYRFSDGSTKKAGTIGHIGTTSFFPSKNLGCFGDGGAIFTNNSAIAERIAMIANHGMKKKYYHDEIGINSRLDTIQAAVLRVKLKYLTNFNATRNTAADFYDSHLKNSNIFITPLRAAYSTHIFHQYTLKTQNIERNALQDFLTQKGIPSMIYYPVPVHLQAAYKKYGFNDFNYPTTNMLSNSVLSLPMHTELTESQLQYIVDSLNEFSTKTEF
jgi:dTDP-4-amino-4,6-dideoxygalactose transaminase